MVIGIETKIFLAFRKAKPVDPDRVQQVALEVYSLYCRDVLSPFHGPEDGPSAHFRSTIEIMLK
jgi:hypothetical protein